MKEIKGKKGENEEKKKTANERKHDSCGFWALLIKFHGGSLNFPDANTALFTLNMTKMMEGGSESLLAKWYIRILDIS